MQSTIKYPKYFLQNQIWVDFVTQALGDDHKILKFRQNLSHSDLNLEVFVYQYPWHLKQSLWYIPRFSGFTDKLQNAFNEAIIAENENEILTLQKLLQTSFIELLQKVIVGAKKHNITFLKLDFDDQLCMFLGIKDSMELVTFFKNQGLAYKLNISSKIIQFTGTMTLDLEKLENLQLQNQIKQADSMDFLTDGLKNFYELNSKQFLKWEKNTRRLTKHSLEKGWRVSVSKTTQNFEGFYELLYKTSKRQNFGIQPKSYLENLFNQNFSRLITIKDKYNQIQGAWFGIVTDQTLTNLYAGNSDLSLKDNGQYLMHLVAIKLALDENLKYYDMGGYNPKLSFGKFKQGYKGDCRFFLGPIDIILKPYKFQTSNLIIRMAKIILGKKDYEY
jgi:lipid II:glycine glycyltransferase (peptidoglycan interpeptide bridge formation enzyme)